MEKDLDRAIQKLSDFSEVMNLNPPAAEAETAAFQREHGIELPRPYIEMTEHFDGGEIFIPGTVIYGIIERDGSRTIKEVNGKANRRNFSIPMTYLIFGKVNYGDWLCIDLENDHEIIQWNHELDSEECRWSSLEEWLSETIRFYVIYEEGAQQ